MLAVISSAAVILAIVRRGRSDRERVSTAPFERTMGMSDVQGFRDQLDRLSATLKSEAGVILFVDEFHEALVEDRSRTPGVRWRDAQPDIVAADLPSILEAITHWMRARRGDRHRSKRNTRGCKCTARSVLSPAKVERESAWLQS
jgi:hypothetical protein